MSLISILSLIVFVLYLQVGLFVLLKNVSSRINRWFFFMSLCIAIWSLGFMFSFKSPALHQTILWDKVSLAGWLLFPAFLIRFKTLLTNIPRSESYKNILFGVTLFISLVFIVFFCFFAGPYRDISNTGDGYFYVNHPHQPVYMALNIFISLGFIVAFFILIRWRMEMTYRREIKQFNLTFYPLLIFVGLSLMSDFILPMVRQGPFPRVAHIFSFFWLAGVAYGILRYRFFTLTPFLAAEKVMAEIKQLLFFCDARGMILRSNPFTEKLLRIRSSRLPGRKISELFAEEREMESYISWAMKNNYSGPVELNIRSFQGELIPVSLSIVLVKDDFDDVQGLMIYGHDNREAIKLRNEIFMREQVEIKLRNLSDMLEAKVRDRTAELAGSYKELQVKITERQQVEEQIKADIAEKDVLINEIHNRVKSNMDLIMALIDTHRFRGFTPKVNKKFRELNRRVAAILLIQENLYLSLNYSEVDFGSFLKQLVRQLAEFYKRDKIVEVELEICDIFLDIDSAIPLGLVANEIISNAFNHGFSSLYLKQNEGQKHMLKVVYRQQDDQVELAVEDNGKGLPDHFRIFDQNTNGLPLVDVLVNDQINGTLEIHSDEGTQARVMFPVEKFKNQRSV
ncbi:MAG: histidine kinase dimerization/phosphoacceptor domain -containing protein [Bacteroidales bacterium]